MGGRGLVVWAVVLGECAGAGAANVDVWEQIRRDCTEPATAAFHRGCAANSINAVDAQVCAREGLPRGEGHLFVWFEPSGRVSKVEIDRGPFSGTEVGACLEAQYGKARIPAFPGPAVRVGKSVRLR